MSWDKYIKRYIWDDEKTPYLVPADKLTRTQAEYEILAYVFFLMILFGVICVVALTDRLPHGRSYGISIYAFSIVLSSVIFGLSKHLYAAIYNLTGPMAGLLYFFVNGFHPRLDTIDEYVILIVLVLWLRYATRVVAIAKAFDRMPDAAKE
jgi:hypothetical protein